MGHIKNIEHMSPKELATELRLWANTYPDFLDNYDVALLLKCARIIEKIPEGGLTPAKSGV